MIASDSHMRREILECPAAIARLLGQGRAAIRAAAAGLRQLDPAFLATVARGSSDHAATYFKYACELTLGLPVASLGPSVVSVYGKRLKLPGAGVLAISQSGKSPDNISMLKAAREQDALTLAITNAPDSPLGQAASHVIDLCAGQERSVAATKTFVTSATAGLALVAEWSGDAGLLAALDRLPDEISAATAINWAPLAEALDKQRSLYVLGRGPGLAIASEAALKFKEVAQIHAEAYSSAEVLHGPVSIVDPGYVVLSLAIRDAAEDTMAAVADEIGAKGAFVFATSDRVKTAHRLNFATGSHPLTDALVQIVSFYAFIEALARRRGLNPDAPRNLQKVTETL